MPEQRGLVEQLEIRIRNDRAITDKHVLSPNPHRAANAPPAGARHAAFPPAGLTSTSSSFRRPVAMMDMYSGRYARPSLEPYRPPPAVTQFYRALADTSHLQPIATFPSESQHQAPPRSSYRHPSRQHYLTQPYAPQSRGSPRTVSARFPGNPIRKPYE